MLKKSGTWKYLIGKDDVQRVDDAWNVSENCEQNTDDEMVVTSSLQEDSDGLKITEISFVKMFYDMDLERKTHWKENSEENLWNVAAGKSHGERKLVSFCKTKMYIIFCNNEEWHM